ncbi:hypothetical protein U6G28_00160 [Actinomycetaceae bacterium MB13-C1-2]|nr:hypothetical protein U6G28_00160 [Actinomycetaceae bacterium MB13-C1-2]
MLSDPILAGLPSAGVVLGLAVALCGALTVAAGSELQSTAVHRAQGNWRQYGLSPQWLLGLALLGGAICTNFIALALAPVSAVQAMSVVAVAASALYSGITGRVRLSNYMVWSVVVCLGGTVGFIMVVTANPGVRTADGVGSQLLPVALIQMITALCTAVALRVDRHQKPRTTHMALVIGCVGFGSITAVLKVLTDMVVHGGLTSVLSSPLALVSIVSILGGGALSNVLLQRAHSVLPTPTVVATVTTVDTFTAATIGTVVLRETLLTPVAAVLFVAFGAMALAGVVGCQGMRRAPGHVGQRQLLTDSTTKQRESEPCTSRFSVISTRQH